MSERPKPISGFPEFTPDQRATELRWLDQTRKVFESYGYCSIETSAVELVTTLAAKGGDADKEIYTLKRIHDEGEDTKGRLALHYDLTVPLARYVSHNLNDLRFPFKRFQIQKCWRGERPQEGRFREFTQCDVDVIDQDNVSIEFDAELIAIAYKLSVDLQFGPVTIHVNNRKILQGFYEGLGVTNIQEAIRIVDKLDKIGAANVAEQLSSKLSLPAEIVDKCIRLAQIKVSGDEFPSEIRKLGVVTPLLESGIAELQIVLARLREIPAGVVWADLSIARGFDYYTGTVYEGKFVSFPHYPTIFAGGRYDNLVGSYLNRKLPGVGISIGLTRIITKLFNEGILRPAPASPTHILVARFPDVDAAIGYDVANILRHRGFNVEVFHEPSKLAKQIRYADSKRIPFIWFPSKERHEIKNLATGEQVAANPEEWQYTVTCK